MTVYADVLIFLNTFVNFFILLLTSKTCKDGYRLFRIITASLIGATFSLYIFLPTLHPIVEAFLKLVVSAVIVLVCFGFDSIKGLARRVSVFFLSSFLYGGTMLIVWMVLKPDNMAINNGIVYLDISPLILISATLISYICISLVRFFSKRQAAMGKRCTLILETDYGNTSTIGLFDTGNSLTDSLTGNSVIIIEKSVAEKLFAQLPTLERVTAGNICDNTNFRVIPFSTVGGKGIITAFKPNNVLIKFDDKQVPIKEVLIGISNEPLGDDYKAIINPDILRGEI